MTREWIIDCRKWRKIAWISLWIGASIGLGYLTYLVVGQYGTTNNGLYVDTCVPIPPTKDNPWGTCNDTATPNYNIETFFIIVAGLANFANYFMIWRTLNNKYRWLRVRCKESEF